MAKMFNRARMSVTSTGTGTLTLGGAVLGYQSFATAGVANGDTVSYVIEDGANFEFGTGTYTSAGTTLSRTVTQSYNGTTYGTSPISVTTSAQVFITALAADVAPSAAVLGMTTGSVPFVSSGTLAQNNSGLFWNNSTGRLGVGTSSPNTILSVVSATDTNPIAYVGGATRGLRLGTNSAASFIEGVDTTGVGSYQPISLGGSQILVTTGGSERMRIDSSGRVGIGVVPNTYSWVNVGATITGQAFEDTITISAKLASDVTSAGRGVQSQLTTGAAAAYNALIHFYANPAALFTGSSVTSQVGFYAESSLIGATSNYGFYSNIASGTGRWNFYAAGTADNYFAGPTGIGVVASTTEALKIGANLTGTRLSEVGAVYSISNDVTGNVQGFVSSGGTQAGSNTISNWWHFRTYQGTIGAGSTVTNQAGYYADATMVGATNNYGFYGNIASGTGRWNFYAAGTADNYFSGNVGIGVAPATKLDVSGQIRSLSGAYSIFGGASTGNDGGISLIANGNTQNTNDFLIAQQGTTSTAFVYNRANAAIIFGTNNAERMRIDNSGRVGIGTSSPSYLLSLTTSQTLGAQVVSNNANETFTIGIKAPTDGASSARSDIQFNTLTGTGGSNSNIAFYTNFYGASYGERMRVDSLGNLLVGGTAARATTTGTAHLDLFNGTAPAGTLTNGISLYSSSGDFNFMDASGNGYQVGYRNIPQNAKTANYTLIASDVGKHISITTGGVNVPVSVFSPGDVVTIFNNSGSSQTITQNASVTLRLAGTATTGSRTLAQYGVSTILCIVGGATPTFVISGAGVT